MERQEARRTFPSPLCAFASNDRRLLDCPYQSDNLIGMETTLTDFQRNFSAARAAADRGETIKVKSAEVVYVFARQSGHPAQPFADLEHLFGVVRQPQRSETAHEAIRHRFRARRTG
jgi:hypothetical protein